MKRLLTLIGAGSLVLAACGDDDDNASDNVSSVDNAAATTVTVVQVDGLGAVLADADGMVLYHNDQEAAGAAVVCLDACIEEWPPLIAGSGTPTGEGVTGLGVSDRPDGTSLVTYNGEGLYTFADDSPGEASGDGDADEFDGQQFSWHAVVVNSAGASGGAATTMPAGGTQTSDTTASDGTGY
jgi:predicted lipoprotein with Yx(FWY)xxD motif